MQIGDVGVAVEIQVLENGVVKNISAATTLTIFAKPQNGAVKSFTASFTTDGTDGKLRYVTTSASDFDRAGEWQVQGKIVTASQNYRTEIGTVYVGQNL